MNGTIKIEEDSFASMTPEQKAYIRTLGNAWREAADLRAVVRLQEAKLAELTTTLEQRQVFLDRCNEAMKAQAFMLGKQDRELMQLRSKVAELQAALKAERDDNKKAHITQEQLCKVILRTRKRARSAEAQVAELQGGDVGRLRSTVNFQHAEIARLKAALSHKQAAEGMTAAIANMGTALMQGTATAIVEDQITLETKVKALQNDVERLKGIADHSNNLAAARLEEVAKLRKELAVTREVTAKLNGELAERETMVAVQNADLQRWRHVADRATRVAFQRLKEKGQSGESGFIWDSAS